MGGNRLWCGHVEKSDALIVPGCYMGVGMFSSLVLGKSWQIRIMRRGVHRYDSALEKWSSFQQR